MTRYYLNKKPAMKPTIRLTESQLTQIVTETVKKVLKEEEVPTNNEIGAQNSWYGDFRIVENIGKEAKNLINNLESNYWEEFDNPDKYPMVVELHNWAFKIVEDCKRFCNYNTHYSRVFKQHI